MCGRYLFCDDKNPYLIALREKIKVKMQQHELDEISLFEVFPSQLIIVGIETNNQFGYKAMKWGLPMDKKLVINSRNESLSTNPFYQDFHPCIIPCAGYYEWSKNPRQKYYFSIPNETLFLAGIYKKIKGNYCVSILTENAQLPEASIHPRQPIILSLEDARKWCHHLPLEMELLTHSLQNRIMEMV